MFDLLCRRRILENLRYPVVDKIFFCSVQAVVLLGNLPNGLRYLRWGGGRRSRPTGKMKRRRKLLEMCAESPASGARFVRLFLWFELDILSIT